MTDEKLYFTTQLEDGRVHVLQYGKDAYEACKTNLRDSHALNFEMEMEEYAQVNDTHIRLNSYCATPDAIVNCPKFVHTYYEVGTSCPEGFAVMNSYAPEEGEAFVQCGGVISNAVVNFYNCNLV